MRIALIADWLTTIGGAEHVLATLANTFPHADIFTTIRRRRRDQQPHNSLSYHTQQSDTTAPLEHANIISTPLQRLYDIVHIHQILLPLMPRVIEDIDLREYDFILSSSHAVGKGIIPPSHAFHACYCHTPMRYAWEMQEEYLQDFHIPSFIRPVLRHQLRRLRRWDLATAKRVDLYLANSTATQQRISRIYGRESVLLPPPVHQRFFDVPLPSSQEQQPYFLAVGRLVPYKRFDLLIEVANALHIPLKIVGIGMDIKRLKKLAGPMVEFLGHIDDAALPALYAGALAILFPQWEDAGIVPLEAQASGTPVIAFARGGALDVVTHEKTGIFFQEQTAQNLTTAIQHSMKVPWNRSSIRASVAQYSQENFTKKLLAVLQQGLRLHNLHFPSVSLSSSISPTISSSTSSKVTLRLKHGPPHSGPEGPLGPRTAGAAW